MLIMSGRKVQLFLFKLVFMLFNWIPSMTMLMTPMTIAEMEKMAILAIMATIVMAKVTSTWPVKVYKELAQ